MICYDDWAKLPYFDGAEISSVGHGKILAAPFILIQTLTLFKGSLDVASIQTFKWALPLESLIIQGPVLCSRCLRTNHHAESGSYICLGRRVGVYTTGAPRKYFHSTHLAPTPRHLLVRKGTKPFFQRRKSVDLWILSCCHIRYILHRHLVSYLIDSLHAAVCAMVKMSVTRWLRLRSGCMINV